MRLPHQNLADHIGIGDHVLMVITRLVMDDVAVFGDPFCDASERIRQEAPVSQILLDRMPADIRRSRWELSPHHILFPMVIKRLTLIERSIQTSL